MKPSRKRQLQVDAPRLLAVEALLAVDVDGKYANLVLPQLLKNERLENPQFNSQDAAFVSELVYGTVRRERTLDAVLAPLSTRPLDELDPAVLACLRLGAYQLLYMRVPDHAAVAETVSVARELAGDGPSKMVNAVLRSLLREGKEEAIAKAVEAAPEESKLGVEYSHPNWAVDAFADALRLRGMEDELPQALAANNIAAPVNLVARPGLIDPQELAEEAEDILGTAAHQGNLAHTAVIIGGGDPGSLPSVRQGVAAVQDEGSQLAALTLVQAPLVGSEDNRWLDLCAGPGGKTALLAALGASRGATVLANEISPHRARLVERSVQALDNVEVKVGDGRKLKSETLFDRVLVDAPCLGLGSLRRRPESRWHHKPTDLDELVPLQWELLSSAVALTRPGGVIAWVTCSPHPRETVDQISHALTSLPVSLLNAPAIAEEIAPVDLASTPGDSAPARLHRVLENTIQLWPHRNRTDAMFIALLRKEA